MRIIAISNQKGGVAKTTTTISLGAALAERGRKVLLVDLDQQGSLTICGGLNPEVLEETIYDVLSSYADIRQKHPLPLTPLIQPVAPNVDLVPANGELAALDLELDRALNREFILKRALDPVRERYDYILLDCPPNLSLLVVNALTTADEVLIPLQADYLATKGVRRLLDLVEAVQGHLNSRLRVAGILLTMADQRTSHTREVIEATREQFAHTIRVFDAVIKMSVRLKESPLSGQSILMYDPRSEASRAYRRLAEELEDETR